MSSLSQHLSVGLPAYAQQTWASAYHPVAVDSQPRVHTHVSTHIKQVVNSLPPPVTLSVDGTGFLMICVCSCGEVAGMKRKGGVPAAAVLKVRKCQLRSQATCPRRSGSCCRRPGNWNRAPLPLTSQYPSCASCLQNSTLTQTCAKSFTRRISLADTASHSHHYVCDHW